MMADREVDPNTDEGSEAAVTMAAHWDDLVAVAMLGTDRRNPPDPPAPIADLVADTVRTRPSERMLAQVAAAVATRRAGVLPAAPVGALIPPPADDRPVLVPVAAEHWYRITQSWPVLEDEWMLAVLASGRRVPPDLVPDLLVRHRSDPIRYARAAAVSGPLAGWLGEQLPDLAARSTVDVDEAQIAELPELPIPTDLATYLTAAGSTGGPAMRSAIEGGDLVHAHRAVLINVVARVHPDALTDFHRALAAVDTSSTGYGLASVLADVAATRRSMLADVS